MFFFFRKKKREAEIQAIKTDISDRSEKASAVVKKVNKVLDGDVTMKIFLATGGERRQKHGR